MKRDPKRALLLALRRRVHTHSRFTVEPLGEGLERLTCRTCSHVIEQPVGGIAKATGKPAFSAELADRMAKYRKGVGDQDSVSGECPKCTEMERDRRYPLPSVQAREGRLRHVGR